KHLYIHIPFCASICKFCDFQRIRTNDETIIKNYVNEIIHQVKLTSSKKQYKTIYLGGGTPNFLPNNYLDKLLSFLKEYLDEEYEFTIECNPDLINLEQILIFKKNKLNRVSLGVQSTNNQILKQMNRTHTIEDVNNSIDLLKNNGIKNISCDFIYNLPNETVDDLLNIKKFIFNHQIKHVSIYSLEIKENAILNREKYKISNEIEEDKLSIIKEMMNELGYKRYEVSNWSIENNYSYHNLAYWQTEPWKAIGFGSHGFEHQTIYQIGGTVQKFYVNKIENLSLKDYYFQILMMGLRLESGINLNIERNKQAYLFFKEKLKNITIENNFLKANNIDLLDDILIDLIF
ncbi:MAG: radical SAM family heme chaperone HemW, partial [Ureaplasma sp.]|nr:radical SAM family heme chaperone HemW [Ureaplasma sp.]